MNPFPFEALKSALFAVLVGAALGFGYLWRNEVESFAKYKATVEAMAQAQEESNRAIEERNKQITKDAQDEYEKRIADLRSYYAGRVLHTPRRSGDMPGISKPPARIDEIPSDVLPVAEQCAETTLQLISLQGWITEVSK